MSFSSGVFSINSTGQPVVTGTTISSTVFNAFTADIATGLSSCMLKDGTQTITSNIPMSNFKFTGLAAGTAAGNSLRYEQIFSTAGFSLLGPINETKTTVASASGPDIWSSIGNVVDYTGTVTATSFAAAPQAGARRTLLCAGAAPFTAGANMLIQGYLSGATFTATAGDLIDVLAVTTTQFRLVINPQSGQTVAGPVIPRGYLAGLTMSTAGASATMSIAVGQAMDSTGTTMMALTSAISKTTSGWAVGSGNGGLDTSTIANTTWYKFYEIMRVDTGVVDVIFTTAALGTGPLMPTNYTKFRYIGSGLTNGSAQWVLFVQDGDLFQWAIPIQNVNTSNAGTTAVSATTTTPLGVNVVSWISGFLHNQDTTNQILLLSDLATTDNTPDTTVFYSLQTPAAGVSNNFSGDFYIRTNTSSQIRYRIAPSTGVNDVIRISTKGWIDARGRNT